MDRWRDRTYFLSERDFLFSAFALRKLEDAGKLASSYSTHQVHGTDFKLRDGMALPNRLDRWNPEKFYDIDTGTRRTRSLPDVADLIIHSHILAFVDGGVLVNSDRKRTTLFEIPIKSWAAVLRRYGTEDIVQATMDDPGVRISNHDMVDRGVAVYADESKSDIDYIKPLNPDEPFRLFMTKAYYLET
jgi:hypothetical protein